MGLLPNFREDQDCFRFCQHPVRIGLALIAPFADEMETAFKKRIVVGCRRSAKSETDGFEGRGWCGRLALRSGFRWGGWDRGENEVVRVGELPGVVGGGLNEVAIDLDCVFFRVEIDAGEPEFTVGGPRVGAAGLGDVEVGNRNTFGVDKGARGGVAIVDMPSAH